MTSALPILASRNLAKLSPLQKPIQSWVETLSQVEDKKVGLVDLHPKVFAVSPRLDILAKNVYWQHMYKKIVNLKTVILFFKFNKRFERIIVGYQQELKCQVETKNLGNKKVLVKQDMVVDYPHNGCMVV